MGEAVVPSLRLVVRCLTEPCVICRDEVHTCELGECPEGFAHLDGSQLPSGSWVCSPRCYETATAWPPKRDRLTIPCRVLCGVGLALAATSFTVRPGAVQLGVAMAGLVSILFCAVLVLVGKVPAETAGKVTSRGRR